MLHFIPLFKLLRILIVKYHGWTFFVTHIIMRQGSHLTPIFSEPTIISIHIIIDLR